MFARRSYGDGIVEIKRERVIMIKEALADEDRVQTPYQLGLKPRDTVTQHRTF